MSLTDDKMLVLVEFEHIPDECSVASEYSVVVLVVRTGQRA